MAKRRFQKVGTGSFFGQYVYERVVPRDHFLVKLNQLIDWDPFIELMVPPYKGLAETGRPPYSPLILLKMLIVAYLYDFSERQVEEVTNYHLAIKEFVGLAVDEAAPDHSTLSDFKRRLRKMGAWSQFEAIGESVLQQALGAGIQLGQVQVVDSVHTVADVYAGDKAYDDTDLHYRLWHAGKHSALRWNDYRTSSSNAHSRFWQQVKDRAEYQLGEEERYKIERKFGEAKRWHGFGRCRYLGLVCYGIRAHLTALVLNLKRIVTLLTGARFQLMEEASQNAAQLIEELNWSIQAARREAITREMQDLAVGAGLLDSA